MLRHRALEHLLVSRVVSRWSDDVDASARGDSKADQYGGVHARAVYPGVRKGVEIASISLPLTLDPVDERLAVVVHEMGERAARKDRAVGGWRLTDDVTCQVERIRWM
jgi:hypothetical protein